MPNQNIPLTLTWGSPPNPPTSFDADQLGAFIAKYMGAVMVSNFPPCDQVATDPLVMTTQLIFNYAQGVFKYWSGGKYVLVTPYKAGDTKNSYVGTDDLAGGWVLLNGRVISTIAGSSAQQQGILSTLFPGAPPTLPTVVPRYVNTLPPVNAFGNIVWPAIDPANGVIGTLPIGAGYTQAEVEALRDNTEILRDTVNNVQLEIQDFLAVSQSLLSNLYGTTTPALYALTYAGPP